MNHEFKMSRDAVRRYASAVARALLFALAFCVWLCLRHCVGNWWWPLAGGMVCVFLAAIIGFSICLAISSREKVIVTDSELIRLSGKSEIRILWDQVATIRVVGKPPLRPVRIEVTDRQGRSMVIAGLFDMQAIAAVFEERLPGRCTMPPESVVGLNTAVTVALVALVTIDIAFGLRAMIVLLVLSGTFGYGAYMLIWSPLPKVSLQYGLIERLVGGILLLFGIVLIAYFLGVLGHATGD